MRMSCCSGMPSSSAQCMERGWTLAACTHCWPPDFDCGVPCGNRLWTQSVAQCRCGTRRLAGGLGLSVSGRLESRAPWVPSCQLTGTHLRMRCTTMSVGVLGRSQDAPTVSGPVVRGCGFGVGAVRLTQNHKGAVCLGNLSVSRITWGLFVRYGMGMRGMERAQTCGNA